MSPQAHAEPLFALPRTSTCPRNQPWAGSAVPTHVVPQADCCDISDNAPFAQKGFAPLKASWTCRQPDERRRAAQLGNDPAGRGRLSHGWRQRTIHPARVSVVCPGTPRAAQALPAQPSPGAARRGKDANPPPWLSSQRDRVETLRSFG